MRPGVSTATPTLQLRDEATVDRAVPLLSTSTSQIQPATHASEVLATVFWDADEILSIGSLPCNVATAIFF